MTEQWLTTHDVAKMLRKHPATVRIHAAAGDLPAVKIGRVWRFNEDELRAHLTRPRDPWAKPVRPLRGAA